MSPSPSTSGEPAAPDRPARGRKRDPARDGAILDAALDVLAEAGYEGMTMDMVATRAKAGKATVYRRWSSKQELIEDAIRRLVPEEVDLEQLPDTGALRGDLLALVRPEGSGEQQRRMRVMAGLAPATLNDPDLAKQVYEAVVGPWVQVNRLLIQRAVDRGELPAGLDVDTFAYVLPSMVGFRGMIERREIDDEGAYIVHLLDTVLLPAIRGTAA